MKHPLTENTLINSVCVREITEQGQICVCTSTPNLIPFFYLNEKKINPKTETHRY